MVVEASWFGDAFLDPKLDPLYKFLFAEEEMPPYSISGNKFLLTHSRAWWTLCLKDDRE